MSVEHSARAEEEGASVNRRRTRARHLQSLTLKRIGRSEAAYCSILYDSRRAPLLLPLLQQGCCFCVAPQLHPLVEPHVSHFSQVPFRTMVKLWHSRHSLPV